MTSLTLRLDKLERLARWRWYVWLFGYDRTCELWSLARGADDSAMLEHLTQAELAALVSEMRRLSSASHLAEVDAHVERSVKRREWPGAMHYGNSV